jgi:hypothetical protein
MQCNNIFIHAKIFYGEIDHDQKLIGAEITYFLPLKISITLGPHTVSQN